MFRRGVFALIAAAVLWGCNSAATTDSPSTPQASSAPAPAVAAKTQQPIVSQRNGKPDFELVRQGSTVQVRCGSTTYTSKIEADRVKVLADDKLVAKVKQKKGGFELEDGNGARLLRAKVKAGPSLKLEDGRDQLLFQIDAAGPTLIVRAGNGGARGSVQKGATGLEWVDATKKVQATMTGTEVIAVGLVLPLESLTSEQRAAVALYLAEVGP